MKPIAVFVLLFALGHGSYAQYTLANTEQIDSPPYPHFSPNYFDRDERKFSTVTKLGAISSIVGPAVFFIGKDMVQQADVVNETGKLKTGAYLYGSGLLLTGAGVGMLVGGLVHDYVKEKKRIEAAKARRARRSKKTVGVGTIEIQYNIPYRIGIAYNL